MPMIRRNWRWSHQVMRSRRKMPLWRLNMASAEMFLHGTLQPERAGTTTATGPGKPARSPGVNFVPSWSLAAFIDHRAVKDGRRRLDILTQRSERESVLDEGFPRGVLSNFTRRLALAVFKYAGSVTLPISRSGGGSRFSSRQRPFLFGASSGI